MTGQVWSATVRPALTRAWSLLTCLALISGCGGSQPISPPRSAPARVPASPAQAPAPSAPPGLDGCLPAARWQIRTIADPGGGQITLGVLGTGRRAVILSNESDEDLCSWLPFARRLAAQGYRVVVWDYGGNEPPEELLALARWARKHGATRIVLMGASEGAKTSLVAAAVLGHAVSGVVSLSAESVLRPGILVIRSVRRLHCPLLLATSAEDPYGSAQATPEFMTAAPSRDKRVVTVPGADHGTALLSGPAAAMVLPAVLTFLRRALT